VKENEEIIFIGASCYIWIVSNCRVRWEQKKGRNHYWQGHGGGVEGAKVILTSDGSELTTSTDSSGNFIFSGLSPGTYHIKLTKDGFYDRKGDGIEVEEGKETKFEIGMIIAFGGT